MLLAFHSKCTQFFFPVSFLTYRNLFFNVGSLLMSDAHTLHACRCRWAGLDGAVALLWGLDHYPLHLGKKTDPEEQTLGAILGLHLDPLQRNAVMCSLWASGSIILVLFFIQRFVTLEIEALNQTLVEIHIYFPLCSSGSQAIHFYSVASGLFCQMSPVHVHTAWHITNHVFLGEAWFCMQISIGWTKNPMGNSS